jgi:hypothetical protein
MHQPGIGGVLFLAIVGGVQETSEDGIVEPIPLLGTRRQSHLRFW